MGVKYYYLAWLTTLYYSCLARCDTPGFIFPANDTSGDATLSDISVHFNDSIVVEYTADTGGIVLLSQYCYSSSQNPYNETYDNPQTLYLSSSCKYKGTREAWRYLFRHGCENREEMMG
jgi:hypothetical protein